MSNDRYAVGVDLGGTFLKLALLDGENREVARDRVPTDAVEGHEAVLRRMVEGIGRMAAQAPPGAVAGVGLGVPGLLDMETGTVIDLHNLPGRWNNVPAADFLRRETGLPTHLINDARAFVLAEHGLGAAKGTETALFFTIGTGIGGGFVANGRLVFGLGGAAGEVGHIIIEADGPPCPCGNRGCVEAVATGPAVAAEAMRRVVQGFTTEIGQLADGDLDAITPELVDRAAEAGDQVAIEVLERAGHFLGLAMAGAIAVVAPEVVVIGGGVARPGGVYWRTAEATARANSHVTPIDRIEFRPAALGYDAGVIGAALWGREQALSRGGG
jgi:glucokinase